MTKAVQRDVNVLINVKNVITKKKVSNNMFANAKYKQSKTNDYENNM